MDARDFITVGMSAERLLRVTAEVTVRHFLPIMPAVFATPMMILEMEWTSCDAIAAVMPEGFVTVGTEVDIRHLAAAPVGHEVRTTARVTAVERKVIRFEVEAFDGDRRIGEGGHARGLVNVASFTRRLGESQATSAANPSAFPCP
jgi:fluoroacetyl-CoA thioesterase